MDTVLNVLHVASAVFLAGPMAVLPMTALRAARAGNGSQVRTLARSTFVFSLLSILIVIFGFGLMGISDYDISITTPWILWALVAWLVAILLSLFVVVPAMRGVGTRLADDDADSSDRGGYALVASCSGLVALLLLLAVVLMAWKP